MNKLPSLTDLWQRYFLDIKPVKEGDAWTIVFIAQDNHGVLVSLANPFTEEHDEVIVSDVAAEDLALFTSHYKKRFMMNLGKRFGLFRPDVNRVLTEYPDWGTFYGAWLNDNTQLVQGNMPLLFDYPAQDEYRAMQLKDADYAGYRRLMVVIYQYRKQQFQRVFIKNVDDHSYLEIQRQIIDLYRDTLPELIAKKTVVTL